MKFNTIKIHIKLLKLLFPLIRALDKEDKTELNRIKSEVDRLHKELGHYE